MVGVWARELSRRDAVRDYPHAESLQGGCLVESIGMYGKEPGSTLPVSLQCEVIVLSGPTVQYFLNE